MALSGLRRIARFVGAEGVEAVLPHVTKHPRLIGKLLDAPR